MDYKNVKKMVIANHWKAVKSGDQYRSFVKQIDNIMKKLQDLDSPLSLLPLDIMTENELAKFIEYIITKRSEKNFNRLFLNTLKNKGLKNNLEELWIQEGNSVIQEILKKEFPTMGNLKIRELIPEVKIHFRIEWLEKNKIDKKAIIYVTRRSNDIWEEIQEEAGLGKMLGIEVHNPDYLEAYIDFAECVVNEVLIFYILLNDKFDDKKETLDFIWEQMNKITDEAVDEIIKQHKKVWKKLYKKCNIRKGNLDNFTEYLVSYLERKSFYEEKDKIQMLLLEEMKENEEIFHYSPRIEREIERTNYTPDKLQEYILCGDNAAGYKIKIEETKKIMKLVRDYGNQWIDENNLQDIRVVYRELFISKCRYNKKQGMRVVRDLMKKEKQKIKDLRNNQERWIGYIEFLDMKIKRGYFCEWGILDWYADYYKIAAKFRKQLLKVYWAVDDTTAYQLVNRILYDFLDIVYYLDEMKK